MLKLLVVVYTLGLVQSTTQDVVCDPVPGTPVNKPMGKAKGIMPGRVSWNYQPGACSWDGTSKYWWSSKYTHQELVDQMLDDTLLSITGEKSIEHAWKSIFEHFNERHFGTRTGYQSGESIAIKLNLNTDVHYTTFNNYNSVSPQFIRALARSLVYSGKVDQKDIVMYDSSRWIQTYYWDEPTGIGTEFPHVNLVDAEGGMPYVSQVQVDHDVEFLFSDPSVPAQKTSKLPKCLTNAKYLIQINAFRGHDLAGITETGKNWFGSIYRPDVLCNFTGDAKALPGHFCPITIHKYVNISGVDIGGEGGWLPQRPMSVYNVLVDLLGHDHTAEGKGLIFFSDGLYGGPKEGADPPMIFDMKPFNGKYSCSVFASIDPIALDSVLYDFLRNEPNQHYPKVGCVDNYLHESALADDPPSKIVYAPSGKQLKSLGVHEHWNNVDNKEYSRNLGTGDGIELIKVHEN